MEKLTRKEVFSLSLDAYYKRSTKDEYSAEERHDGFVEYLKDLNKDYRNNKNEIFQIIEQTATEILPKKINDIVKDFAEFKDFPDNTQVKFKVKNGKIKAVEVALGGGVQRQRIDKGSFTMKTEAIQCKVFEEYERVIGGMVNWSELVNMVVEAIMESILEKVYLTLTSIYSKLPSANKATSADFDSANLDKIINTIKAYGRPCIMGTPTAVSSIALDTSVMSEADKMDLRNRGFIGMYKGCPVIEMPNSFEDESNTTKVFEDKNIFIIPAGAEKVVKVAMEGGFKIRETNGEDWTVNFEMYQKLGVSLLAVNHIGIYQVTNLDA